MSGRVTSLSRDLARLYVLYMAAAATALPVAVIYALIVLAGWERWWTVLPLLAAGFYTASVTWRYLDARLTPKTSGVVVVQFASNRAYQDLSLGAAVAGVAVFVLLPIALTAASRSFVIQPDTPPQAVAEAAIGIHRAQ